MILQAVFLCPTVKNACPIEIPDYLKKKLQKDTKINLSKLYFFTFAKYQKNKSFHEHRSFS